MGQLATIIQDIKIGYIDVIVTCSLHYFTHNGKPQLEYRIMTTMTNKWIFSIIHTYYLSPQCSGTPVGWACICLLCLGLCVFVCLCVCATALSYAINRKGDRYLVV